MSKRRREDKSEQRPSALHWSTRLTIILVGTCLLFSLFFGLEFFFAKLATFSTAQETGTSLQPASPQPPEIYCEEPNRLNNLKLPEEKRQEQENDKLLNLDAGFSGDNKLKVNFDLIYEGDLKVDEEESRYVIEDAEKGAISYYSMEPEMRLARLLRAHHAAMPFDPDIWLHSEPEEQMDLLWGQLDTCIEALASINEAMDKVDQLSGLRKLQLIRLLDSFGRTESGTLAGHPFWMGSYLQCVQLSSQPPTNKARGGRQVNGSSDLLLETGARYCVGKVTLRSWPHELRQPEFGVHVKVGLCLPAACDSLALFRHQQQRHNDSNNNNGSLKLELMRRQVERLMLLNLRFNQLDRSTSINGAQQKQEVNESNSNLQLVDIYCLPVDESRTLGAAAFLLILFILSWLSFGGLCTWIQLRRRRRQQVATNSQSIANSMDQRIVEAFAIDLNVERFFFGAGERQPEVEAAASGDDAGSSDKLLPVVNLNVLDSFKHLGCVGVIAAHVLLTYLTLGTSYGHTVDHFGKDMRTMLLLSLNNVVDSFFVISGLLAAYLMLKKSPEMKKASDTKTRRSFLDSSSHYLRIVGARYLRMAPLYFLVYAFAKTLSVHLGSGPLWDYATNLNSLRGSCQQESWLWPLAFASDFKPITEHCVPPAWSLAVDLQLFLFLPPLIELLRLRPRFGRSLLLALIVGSSAYTLADYRSLLSYVSERDFAKLRLHVFTVLIKHVAHAYSQPQNRMGPTLIGLLGGHLLFEYEQRAEADTKRTGDGSSSWPKWMRGAYFRCALLAGFLFAAAPALVQLRERARSGPTGSGLLINRLLFLDSSAQFDCHLALAGFVLIKPLWSACNCVMFLRLATDLNSTLLGRLLSMGAWRSLSKLNYAILLIHFELIAYEAMSRLALVPVTWSYLMSKFAFAYLSSLLVALPLYLLFELPAHKLTSRLLALNNDQHNNRMQ